MTDKEYITGMDLLNFLNRLDYTDLLLPIGVSEKVAGVNKPYFDDEPIFYAVRISSVFRKSQDFDGWLIEGLTLEHITKLKEENKKNDNE